MIFSRQGFSRVNQDNEEVYFNFLQTLVEASDTLAEGNIVKSPSAIIVRITPSKPNLYKLLFQTVKDANNAFGLRVEFSKSISSSHNIVYRINLNPS